MVGCVVAGVIVGWGLVLAGLTFFFGWGWARGREQVEYLVFGAFSAASSLYSAGIALFYMTSGRPDWLAFWPWMSGLGVVGAILSLGFLMHFTLLIGNFRRHRAAVPTIYGVVAFYLLVYASGRWWRSPPSNLQFLSFPFGELASVTLAPTLLGASFSVLVVLAALGLGSALIRRVSSGDRDLGWSLGGALVLMAALINDSYLVVARAFGFFLAPLGFLVFAFGVAMTLVHRYGRVSLELAQSSSDLKKSTTELRRSYDALQAAQAELVKQEQLAMVGELAAVIAHEVRNPLAVISNAVAGLRRDGIEISDRRILLEIINEESSRLNRLVSDLLSYARPITPQRHPTSLVELLERALSLHLASYPRVTLQFHADPATPLISIDAGLLRQVIDNLVGNAIQAMRDEGVLTVHLGPHRQGATSGVRIEIQDTGEGMDTLTRTQAKTPFFTTRPTGTGLGLAIVDRIIDAHGGSMNLESKTGEGTSVQIFLPEEHSTAPPLPSVLVRAAGRLGEP